MGSIARKILKLSQTYHKMAQEFSERGVRLAKPQESSGYVPVSLCRLFADPDPTEIGDWVHTADKDLLYAPQQYFQQTPILLEDGKNYVIFAISPNSVLRVSLLEDTEGEHHGVLGSWRGTKIYWSIIPRKKATGTNITPETHKSIRFVISCIMSELFPIPGKPFDLKTKTVQGIVDAVKKYFPNGVEQIEATIALNKDWLDKLSEEYLNKALRGQLHSPNVPVDLKTTVVDGYLKIG